jgi:hypothetical protein
MNMKEFDTRVKTVNNIALSLIFSDKIIDRQLAPQKIIKK